MVVILYERAGLLHWFEQKKNILENQYESSVFYWKWFSSSPKCKKIVILHLKQTFSYKVVFVYCIYFSVMSDDDGNMFSLKMSRSEKGSQ